MFRVITVMLGISFMINASGSGKYSSDDYVICDIPESEYSDFLKNGSFKTRSLDEEGFIHCAKPSQLRYVMNKFFKGDSYRLFISSPERLGEYLKYEGSDSENLYPHLYREFQVIDVIESLNIQRDSKGEFQLPEIFIKD